MFQSAVLLSWSAAYYKRIYKSEKIASRRKYKQNIENLQVENFAEQDVYFSSSEEKLNIGLKGTYILFK